MDKIFFLRLGGRNLHLAKLIGAFLVVAAVLLFLHSGARMFESWETARSLNECFIAANATLSLEDKMFCQDQASMAGVFVRLDQKELTAKQFWVLLLEPIGWLFIWTVVFAFGMVAYSTGRLFALPVVEKKKKEKRFASRRSRSRR